jgi:hypothetical protein
MSMYECILGRRSARQHACIRASTRTHRHLVDEDTLAHDTQRGRNADSARGAIVHIHVLPNQWHVDSVPACSPLAHAADNQGPKRAHEQALGLVCTEHRRAVDLRLCTCLGGQLLPVPARRAQFSLHSHHLLYVVATRNLA